MLIETVLLCKMDNKTRKCKHEKSEKMREEKSLRKTRGISQAELRLINNEHWSPKDLELHAYIHRFPITVHSEFEKIFFCRAEMYMLVAKSGC